MLILQMARVVAIPLWSLPASVVLIWLLCLDRGYSTTGAIMNRITHLWLAGMILAGVVVRPSSAQDSRAQTQEQTANPGDQSLGTVARAIRKDKKPATTKKFDNDNLPREDKLSVVGQEPGGSSASSDAVQDGASASKPSQEKAGQYPAIQPGQSQEQRQQVYDQWKDKISDQQGQIELLKRELDVTQREYRLREAAMYGDAGERLRNQAQWDKEDADYKQKISERQQALDNAQQKMSDLQEDARKAGVPTSVRESNETSSPNQATPSTPPTQATPPTQP